MASDSNSKLFNRFKTSLTDTVGGSLAISWKDLWSSELDLSSVSHVLETDKYTNLQLSLPKSFN